MLAPALLVRPALLLLLLFSCRPHLAAASPKLWEEVSGERALAHVQQLVDLGPRPSGSEELEKSRLYIEDQLHRSGWQVTRQASTAETPRGNIQFVNWTAQSPVKRNVDPLFLLC